MSYWWIERNGIPFTAMWLKFGNYDPKYSPELITKLTNEASSIYFVTLVVMYVFFQSHSIFKTKRLTLDNRQLFNLLATRTRRLSIFQQPPIFNKTTQVRISIPSFSFLSKKN